MRIDTNQSIADWTSAGAGIVLVVGTELVVVVGVVDVEATDVVVPTESPQAVTKTRERPAKAVACQEIGLLTGEGLANRIYSKLTPSGVRRFRRLD